MHDEYALLVYLSVGLAAALLFGFATERLKLSPIVGYLLAGIIVGPNTPGLIDSLEFVFNRTRQQSTVLETVLDL